MIHNPNIKNTMAFALHLSHMVPAKKIFYLGMPNRSDIDSPGAFVGLFNNMESNATQSEDFLSFDVSKNLEKSYDFVVADLPLNYKPVRWKNKYRINGEWAIMLDLLSLLNKNGHGLFWVAPAFWFGLGKRFQEILNENGFHVNAVFNPPEKILHPYTSLRPNILLLSRKRTDNVFIAELPDASNISKVINNLFNQIDGGSLINGSLVPINDFSGFDKYKFSQEIKKLKIHYKNYDEYILKDIAVEVIAGKTNQKLSEKDNSIYVPKLGTSPIITDVTRGKLKHQNYFQVVLDKKVVLNDYAATFFNSELGKAIYNSMLSGTVIRNINKSDLVEALIPIPSLSEQSIIITTNNKLNNLLEKINDFSKELSLNPSSADDIQDTLDSLLEELDELSISDKVLSIIRSGETKKVEFKSTFRFNLKKLKDDDELKRAVVTTINAFLNTQGGTLFIGVKDNGEVLGIEDDHFKNEDKFALAIIQQIKNYMSEAIASKIDINFIDIDNKKIIRIDVPMNWPEKTFMHWKEEGLRIEKIYVRTGPESAELLPSQHDKHFSDEEDK